MTANRGMTSSLLPPPMFLHYRDSSVLVPGPLSGDLLFLGILKALLKLGNVPSTPKDIASLITSLNLAPLSVVLANGHSTPLAAVISKLTSLFRGSGLRLPSVIGKILIKEHGTRKLKYYILKHAITSSAESTSDATALGAVNNAGLQTATASLAILPPPPQPVPSSSSFVKAPPPSLINTASVWKNVQSSSFTRGSKGSMAGPSPPSEKFVNIMDDESSSSTAVASTEPPLLSSTRSSSKWKKNSVKSTFANPYPIATPKPLISDMSCPPSALLMQPHMQINDLDDILSPRSFDIDDSMDFLDLQQLMAVVNSAEPPLSSPSECQKTCGDALLEECQFLLRTTTPSADQEELASLEVMGIHDLTSFLATPSFEDGHRRTPVLSVSPTLKNQALAMEGHLFSVDEKCLVRSSTLGVDTTFVSVDEEEEEDEEEDEKQPPLKSSLVSGHLSQILEDCSESTLSPAAVLSPTSERKRKEDVLQMGDESDERSALLEVPRTRRKLSTRLAEKAAANAATHGSIPILTLSTEDGNYIVLDQPDSNPSEAVEHGREGTITPTPEDLSGQDEDDTSIISTSQKSPVTIRSASLKFTRPDKPFPSGTNPIWRTCIESVYVYITWIHPTYPTFMLKSPKTAPPELIPVLRRVDNDMVNATCLLATGGLNEQERSIVLSLERNRIRYHVEHSPLFGTWIPLARAHALSVSVGVNVKLAAFLAESLKSYFPVLKTPSAASSLQEQTDAAIANLATRLSITSKTMSTPHILSVLHTFAQTEKGRDPVNSPITNPSGFLTAFANAIKSGALKPVPGVLKGRGASSPKKQAPRPPVQSTIEPQALHESYVEMEQIQAQNVPAASSSGGGSKRTGGKASSSPRSRRLSKRLRGEDVGSDENGDDGIDVVN